MRSSAAPPRALRVVTPAGLGPPHAPGQPAAGDPRCPSCGAPRPARFCPECGERRVDPDDFRLRRFAAHAVDQLFSLDGTLWRTGRALVTRPGLLTAEYIAGRRTGYARPLQLFLLVNVAFFLATGAVGAFRFRLGQYQRGEANGYLLRDTARVRALVAGKARRERVTVADVERRFDAASAAQQSVWLLVAPALAAAVALLYARRRLPYVRHLVFAVHFLAFLLLAAGGVATAVVAAARHVVLPQYEALRRASPEAARPIGTALEAVLGRERFMWPVLAWVAVYLVLALRRVYGDAWGWAAARALVLAALIFPLLKLYRDVLFAVTYLSI
jgi:hypothetical protein